MLSDHVRNHYLIIDEVGRPQDSGAEAQRFRHALCAELYSKVRHVYGLISIKPRQVNDPVNAGFPGYI